jgi:hypothetical protein
MELRAVRESKESDRSRAFSQRDTARGATITDTTANSSITTRIHTAMSRNACSTAAVLASYFLPGTSMYTVTPSSSISRSAGGMNAPTAPWLCST